MKKCPKNVILLHDSYTLVLSHIILGKSLYFLLT